MKKAALFSIFVLFIFCSNPKKQTNPKIEVYDQVITSIIDNTSEIEILGDSISLPEGPVWDEKSNSLLFVDIIANKVLKWNQDEGVTDYIIPSGNTGYAPNTNGALLGANGLSFNSESKLILCQHGDRRIAIAENMQSDNPSFTTLVDNYEGKKLNSPNDLTIASDGSIYFTDPPFGFFDLGTGSFVDSELKELEFSGVFKYDIQKESLSLISDKYLPNGIALSNDEKFLYVNKMGILDEDPKILKINLDDLNVEVLFEGKQLSEKYGSLYGIGLENNIGNFDGMKVHSSGNIFTTGPGGILVISPEGKLLSRINFGHVTNCAFDTNENYLYVTGFADNPKLYRLKLKEAHNQIDDYPDQDND